MELEPFFAEEGYREWVSTPGEPPAWLPRATITTYKERFRQILKPFLLVLPLILFLLFNQATETAPNTLATALYLTWLVGASLLALLSWRQMRRFDRLETGGQIIQGSVIDTSTSWWRYPWVSIRYQFTKADRQVIEGRRSVHLKAMKQPPASGVTVMVLYIDDRTHWML